jgi:hypothetical protein
MLEVALEHAAGAQNPKLLGRDLNLNPLKDVYGIRSHDDLHGYCLARGEQAKQSEMQCSVARKRFRSNRRLLPMATTSLH